MATHRASRLLRLRRGTHVRTRTDGLLQVGTDPGRRCVLPDTTAVRGLLHLLEHGVRAGAVEDLAPVCEALRRNGLLLAPEDEELLARARAATRVHLDVPATWLPELCDLLTAGGLARGEAGDADVVLRSSAAPSPTPATRRTKAKPAPSGCASPQNAAVLHLALVDARAEVGPFVVPGRTACTGCVDAHLREEDPGMRHGTAAVLHPLPSSSEEPAREFDPLLRRAAFTSAVQDVAAWAEGRQPLTWSTTRWFDAAQRVEARTWEPHPACSCAWDAPAPPTGGPGLDRPGLDRSVRPGGRIESGGHGATRTDVALG